MAESLGLEDVAKSICDEFSFSFQGYVSGGQFKSVFRVSNEDGEDIALKVVREQATLDRTIREIDAAIRCNHVNIAKLFNHGSHRFDGHDYIFICEEFLAGGTLTQFIEASGQLGDHVILNFAQQLIDALSHINTLNIVHRDIKPDNIMFRDDQTPVLVDFGLVRDLLAVSLTQTWANRGPGTPYYAAPEQLNNQKELISWRSDQFSLGVVLCFMCCGKHPYQLDTEPTLHKATVERVASYGSQNVQTVQELNERGLDCINKMTSPWPFQRFRRPEDLIDAWNF